MWSIRTCAIFILLALGLTACGGGAGDAMPTLLPTAAVDGQRGADGSDSPRGTPGEIEPTPDTGLPPTWTPEPTPPLPPTAGPPTPEPTRQTYTVQRGDTLAEIAIQFGVTLEALVAENNISNIDLIEVGDVLVIPK